MRQLARSVLFLLVAALVALGASVLIDSYRRGEIYRTTDVGRAALLRIDLLYSTRSWLLEDQHWATGFVAGFPHPLTVPVPATQVPYLRPGTDIAIHPTGDKTQRFVSRGWYDAARTNRAPRDLTGLGLIIAAAALFIFRRQVLAPFSGPERAATGQNPRLIALIQRLEVKAQLAPAAYRRHVLLLAMLAYLYLAAIALVMLAIVAVIVLLLIRHPQGAAILAKVGLVAVLVLYGIGRALIFRCRPPQGLAVTREQCPQLWAMLDRLRGGARGVPIHQVMIDIDFNAGVTQLPRFGLIGGKANYVVIGMPFLASLSPRQLEAVLAHELGHLAREHSRRNAWIYRLRMTWASLYQTMHDQSSWFMYLTLKFFDWYIPYFNAYSFVLARADEYEADRFSVEKLDRTIVAQTLVRTRMSELAVVRHFWPEVYRASVTASEPPAIYARMCAFFDAPLGVGAYDLKQALRVATDYNNTHPCLADRVKAVGETPQLVAARGGSAAAALLGDHLPTVIAQMDAIWRADVATYWRRQFDEAQPLQAELRSLAEKSAVQDLSVEERWRQAWMTERLQGREAALLHYREILKVDPNHPGACYRLGETALERGEEVAGMALLERAMAADAWSTIASCQVIARTLVDRGRDQEAVPFEERAAARAQAEEAARQERARVEAGDRLIAHAASEEQVRAVAERCRGRKEVRQLFLARKHVAQFPEHPLYVLGVRWGRANQKRRDEIVNMLFAECGKLGETLLLMMDLADPAVARALKAVPGSEIYRR
jgi:Zn-dependent protease with chaperone function